MQRTKLLLSSLLVLLLAACARPAPAPETDATSQVAPTVQAVPTSGLGGIGGPAPVGAPTSAPTAEATPTPVETYTVQRGTIESILVLSGQVSPVQNAMAFAQDGVVAEIFVQPGQLVNQGDLVAELDLGDLNARLREAQLANQQDQTSLSRAVEAGRLSVQQAELDLEAARQELEEVRQPATDVEIAEARVAVREAQANLDTVRNNASQTKNTAKTNLDKAVLDLQAIQQDYGDAVNRLEKGRGGSQEKELREEVDALERDMREAEAAVAQAQIDYDTARNNEVAAVQEAEAQLDLVKARLDALLRGPDPFDVADAERAVRRAEIELARTRQAAAPDPSLVRAVEVGRLAVEEIEAQIVARRLYAPFSGEVAVINSGPGLPIQAGEPVVTLVDRSALEIVAEAGLDAAREGAPRLSTGQSVEIRFSRYPNQTFTGTITQAPTPAELDGVASTTYHISFDSQGRELSIGDLAEARIVLGRKYDALWLPPEAVRTSRDRTSVTMRIDGEDKRVDVVVGITTADKVEIVSGLQEGDEVIVVQ